MARSIWDIAGPSADSVTVKITGLDEVNRVLGELPITISRAIMREAITESLEIMKDEMAIRAPRLKEGVKLGKGGRVIREAGELSSGMAINLKIKSDLEAHAEVGYSQDVWWGWWAEMGRLGKSAQPFMAPAYEATKEAVLARFVKACVRIINQRAAKFVGTVRRTGFER
jgi:hypothetical protein